MKNASRLSRAWKWALGLGTLVLLGWLFFWFVPLGLNSESEGQFGDKFGALNTLFTGLALAGLVATLIHQHDEAQASEHEHLRLINAHTAHTEAINAQNRLQIKANYIKLLVARIDGYVYQQRIHPEANNLVHEQHSLLEELDRALNNARQDSQADSDSSKA